MRTLVLLLIGFALLAAMLRLSPPAKRARAALAFVVLWIALGAINLSIGLSRGYSLGEELLIHAVLVGLPVAAALIARRPRRHG